MSTSNTRTGSLIGGALLVGMGLLFLIAQFIRADIWRLFWPVSIIFVGALFFVGMFAAGRSAGGLAIPGSILTGIGLLMLVQSLSGHWASWSYGWTVILMSVGFGIWLMGRWTGNDERQRSGLRLAGLGASLFIIFGSFFELGALLLGARGFWQILFPVLMIGLGLYLAAVRSGLLSRRANSPDASAHEPEPSETGQT